MVAFFLFCPFLPSIVRKSNYSGTPLGPPAAGREKGEIGRGHPAAPAMGLASPAPPPEELSGRLYHEHESAARCNHSGRAYWEYLRPDGLRADPDFRGNECHQQCPGDPGGAWRIP